jgi:L-arabinose transport system substrate-binding protein
VPFVGIDAAAFGANSGKQLGTLYKKSHWKSASTYALLYVLPALPTCNLRTNAEKSALVKAGIPSSHILNVSYDGTETVGLNNTGPVLTAHPQAKQWLLAGCNDDGVYGGTKALTSHGVAAKNVIGVGLGGDLACTIWAAGAPNVGFRATNYINPNAIGAAAVLNMYNFVEKATPFPTNSYVAPISITQADYKSIDKGC